jgi:hypothetical protein
MTSGSGRPHAPHAVGPAAAAAALEEGGGGDGSANMHGVPPTRGE